MDENKVRKITDCDEFFKFVVDTMVLAWGKDWGNPMSYPEFIKAYPVRQDTKDIRTPILTYHMLLKEPARFGSNREIKRRIRAIEYDGNDPRYATVMAGRRYTYQALFSIWDSNWSGVVSLSKRFENFMEAYYGLFVENGVAQMLHVRTTDDAPPSTQLRLDLMSRHVHYEVHIDSVVPIVTPTIQNIRLELGGKRDNGTV